MTDVTKLYEYVKNRTMEFGETIYMLPIPGVTVIDKFAENPNVPINSEGDIWDFGGYYNYTAEGGATYYASSEDPDDKQPIKLSMLTVDPADDSWNQEDVIVNLDGQNKVEVVTPSGHLPIRIWRLQNEADADPTNGQGTLRGDMYVYEDTTVVGGVPQDSTKVRGAITLYNNQSLMGIKTVPSGYTGFIKKVTVGVGRKLSVDANFRYWSRRHGKVWKCKGTTSANSSGNGVFVSERSFYDIAPEKTDIRFSYENNSAACAVYALFDIILIKNELLDTSEFRKMLNS